MSEYIINPGANLYVGPRGKLYQSTGDNVVTVSKTPAGVKPGMTIKAAPKPNQTLANMNAAITGAQDQYAAAAAAAAAAGMAPSDTTSYLKYGAIAAGVIGLALVVRHMRNQ